MIKDKLRHLIISLGLTPEDFAEDIGVGKSGIYKILRGETKKISSTLARKIEAKYSQFTYEEIMSFNNLSDDELIFKGDTKIEVQKIVDIITDNLSKFKGNADFQDILKQYHLETLNEYRRTLEKK